MRTPRYSVKRIEFAVPLIPILYKIHSIMRTLAGLLHKIVQHHWLIHQLGIILTLVRIVLASGYPFLPSYSKEELWNGAFIALNGTSTHFHAYRKPPKSGHLFTQDTLDGTNGVRIIEVPLYTFFQMKCNEIFHRWRSY